MTSQVFKREHHQRIHQVLRALDASMLRNHHCYFGGGTAIVLRHGEYRESADIDFLVSDINAYRALRKQLQTLQGLEHLFGIGHGPLTSVPEVRADQYGIRTKLPLATSIIKFEIVFEARINFDEPRPEDQVGGVATLSEVDLAASKLLANVDRWADAGVYSRDAIDLAMLGLPKKAANQAFEKAQSAYGDAVRRDVLNAVEMLKSRPERLAACLDALAVDIPQALMLDRLKRLAARCQDLRI
jgi:Nucleotidyl transferase AbiEii toxin, Type IV TA system